MEKLGLQPSLPNKKRASLDRNLFVSSIEPLTRPEWWEYQLWRLHLGVLTITLRWSKKTSEIKGEIGSHSEQIIIDFDHMTDKERREMVRRLRQQPGSNKNRQQPVIASGEQRAIEAAQRKAVQRNQQQQLLAARAALIADFAQSIGIDLPQEAGRRHTRGQRPDIPGKS
ncbi:hypothetical protein [Gibbsiella quercinecans]|uniref:hypothetical protein n=1 Tax=Gibbsiella quercinecans TaxID=929813 RepID=UPI00242B8919|nr:hypothetical protein [Gibbsiella quercinecans]